MRYVIAKYNEYESTMAYRIYITDSLYYQAKNMLITKRFYDIIYKKPVDPRSGDQIAADVIKELDLKFGG